MHDDPFVKILMEQGVKVIRGEPMKRHTTWRIGGPADYFVEPDSVDALRASVAPRETMAYLSPSSAAVPTPSCWTAAFAAS